MYLRSEMPDLSSPGFANDRVKDLVLNINDNVTAQEGDNGS